MEATMNLRIAAALIASLAAVAATPILASVTFDFAQVGGNVVLTGNGSYNLNGATFLGNASQEGFVNSGGGLLAVGGPYGSIDAYGLTKNAGAFGTGVFTFDSSEGGNVFGLDAPDGYLTVYHGYSSLNALSGTATFANQTFASLGLNAGTYTYGVTNDTLTINVPNTVPEPAAWAMMLVGFGLIGGVARRRSLGVTSV